MIDFFSKWIEGIAIAVVITTIFEMIIPSGNIKKYIKIVLGIYVIFSIIAPFVDSKDLYSINISKAMDKYYENITDNNILSNSTQSKVDLNKIYIKTLEEEIQRTIEKQGYIVYKCSVYGNFDTEENVGITKIDIIIEETKENKNTLLENDEDGETNKNTLLIEEINEVEKVDVSIGDKKDEKRSNSIISAKDINDLKKYLSQRYEIDKKIININIR